MKMKKSLWSSAIAASLVCTVGAPLAVLAENPETSFYQYKGESLSISQIGQYNSQSGKGGTEILAFDAASKQAFVTNGAETAFDILSFQSLKSNQFSSIPSKKRIFSKDLGIDRVDDITSIASHPTKDLIALAVVSQPKTDPGYIVFLKKDGTYLTKVKVGSLPDMVTFSKDGTKVIVANEGEPTDDYSVDPEGSLSIIELKSQMKQNDILSHTLLPFSEELLDENVRVQSKGTIAQQLEPEYISVSADSKTAYVSMQENNAIATVDLEAKKILHVKGLGVKDHSVKGNELDAVQDGKYSLEKQPLLGYYMPDAIDVMEYKGKTYILTPNEGDARDYQAYSEEASIGDIAGSVRLDAKHYAGYTQEELDELIKDGWLDRLNKTKITTENGQVNDVYESLHSYGTRSFTIFDAETMDVVFDSGSDFERITHDALPEYFNTSNDEINMDKRSSSKGPEPETVVTGEIGSNKYAFIALERISAIMVYDVTNPASSKFVTMISSRDFSENVKGDVSPEGLVFIPASDSPTGKPLLSATHEVSGTVAVYELDDKTLTTDQSYEFNDVPASHWSYSYVNELVNRGILFGTDAHTFSPNKPLTYAQLSSILSRAFPAHSFEQLMTQLNEQNIIPAELIQPNHPLSRAELATILVYAYETVMNTEVKQGSFTYKDEAAIAPYAKEAVQKAYELQVMSGYEQGEFKPNQAATRAQAAKIISLLLTKTK